MNEQPTNVKSASPLGEGERIEVRGFVKFSQEDNPHPALSLGKGEAMKHGTRRKADGFPFSNERATI
jgi:hypothetical protein